MPGFASSPTATQGSRKQPPAIADYGVIGDCRSAALVSRDGAIEWLCWPRFDSAPILDAILDATRGGRFVVRPRNPIRIERSYAGDTNVLLTRFFTATGIAGLVDFMTVV